MKRNRCRWDAAGAQPLPFGKYCDGNISDTTTLSFCSAQEVNARTEVPELGQFWPVHVLGGDTRFGSVQPDNAEAASFKRSIAELGGATKACAMGSYGSDVYYRVAFIGWKWVDDQDHLSSTVQITECFTTILPLQALRPLSPMYSLACDAHAAWLSTQSVFHGQLAQSKSVDSRVEYEDEHEARSEQMQEDNVECGTADIDEVASSSLSWQKQKRGSTVSELDVVRPSEGPPKGVPKKWWARRYALWSRFDGKPHAIELESSSVPCSASTKATCGIMMDEESWWSVTPEDAAVWMAEACVHAARPPSATYTPTSPSSSPFLASATPGLNVLDVFGGVGGNAIAFSRAHGVQGVTAIETLEGRCRMLVHNANVYDIPVHMQELDSETERGALPSWYPSYSSKSSTILTVICGDALAAIVGLADSGLSSFGPMVDILFLAPPWGGPSTSYADGGVYSVSRHMRLRAGEAATACKLKGLVASAGGGSRRCDGKGDAAGTERDKDATEVDGATLLAASVAAAIAHGGVRVVAVFLPRNTDVGELQELLNYINVDVHTARSAERSADSPNSFGAPCDPAQCQRGPPAIREWSLLPVHAGSAKGEACQPRSKRARHSDKGTTVHSGGTRPLGLLALLQI